MRTAVGGGELFFGLCLLVEGVMHILYACTHSKGEEHHDDANYALVCVCVWWVRGRQDVESGCA